MYKYVGTYTYFCVSEDSLYFTVIYLFMAFLYQDGLVGTSAKSYLAGLPYTEIATNGPRKTLHA